MEAGGHVGVAGLELLARSEGERLWMQAERKYKGVAPSCASDAASPRLEAQGAGGALQRALEAVAQGSEALAGHVALLQGWLGWGAEQD